MPANAIDVTFGRERVQDLWDEVQPLLLAHWREIAQHQDIPLDPDRDLYAKMEDLGCLRCFVAREIDADNKPGRIIGYSAFVVRPALHYRGSIQAQQDVVFLLPDYRRSRIGVQLIAFADEQLRLEGVQVVHQHQKNAHPALGAVLSRMGYEAVETIWSKRLDR